MYRKGIGQGGVFRPIYRSGTRAGEFLATAAAALTNASRDFERT